MPKIKKDDFVDGGEAVGIVAAQSIGEPGTQMSLSYHEKVLVKMGGELKIVEIGPFVDGMIKQYGAVLQGDHEVCDLPVELYALSLKNDEKIEWCRVSALSRHSAPEKMVEITLSSGRRIVATPFHSFVVRRDNSIVPVSATSLKKGDRLPVTIKLPAPSNVKTSTGQRSAEYLVSSAGTLYAQEAFKEESDDFGWFVGVYLGSGKISNNHLYISGVDNKVYEKVRSFALERGLIMDEMGAFSVKVDENPVLSDLARLASDGTHKKVPEFIYNASDETLAAFLRGYFDCNGRVDSNKIVFSSSFKEVLDGVALLLARFGIFSIKRGRKLYVPGYYARVFLERIGSEVSEKRSALEKLASRTNANRGGGFDVIPGIGNALLEYASSVGYPLYRVKHYTEKQVIPRTTLGKYLNLFNSLAVSKGLSVSAPEPLRRAVESDVVWDRIVKIDYVPPKEEFVYDFTVPGSETFTTFEGIVTHNTMRTFHYAGVAEQVPVGLPRLIELVDARKEPSKPLTDVYLIKEYEKDQKKAEELAEALEFVCLDDISTIVENFSKHEIRITVDKELAETHKIDVKTIVKKIREAMGKSGTLKYKANHVLVRLNTSYEKLRKLSMKIRALPLKGVKGLTKATVIKDDKHGIYFVRCGGSNINELKKIDIVDFSRIYTNNIKDIEKNFGIEAARNALLREMHQVMDLQGLPVDIRHLMLVADAMCTRGFVEPVGRHGLSGRKSSVLARAAFEETVKHLVGAAIKGEEDKLAGVTENIIIGQTIKLGTGRVKLMMRR